MTSMELTAAATYEICHRCATALNNCDFSEFDTDARSADIGLALAEFADECGILVIDADEIELEYGCDACGTEAPIGYALLGHQASTIVVIR